MTERRPWSAATLARVIALQAEREAAGRAYGALTLRLLNQATLADKARMTPEAIAAEEQARANYRFKYEEPPA
jgi:hypothetical protein